MDIINVKINCNKIDKAKLYKGEKGTYLNVTLLPNKEGTDQYGNDYMVVQDIGKEARDAGEKGAILGNARTFERKKRDDAPVPANEKPASTGDGGLPF